MDCVIWNGYKDRDGYGLFHLNGKLVRLHRLVFFMYNGYYPAVVRHRCDNPSCVNHEHLQAGTNADNVRDRDERGRTAKGDRHHFAKYDEETIRQVVDLRDTGM